MTKEQSLIVIAEHDAALARSFARSLSVKGWSVALANTGAEALDLVARHDPPLLLLDLQLPGGMDGLEVLRDLQGSRTKVVLISGYLDEARTVRAYRLGAHEILEKPLRPQHLYRVLDDLVGDEHEHAPLRVPELVGVSRSILNLRRLVATVAPLHDLSVIILGETGTGKEVVARALHDHSGLRGAFVAQNCAAMPEPLFESQLFGYAAGAFTGAREARGGLLEAASDGTLFLDEVGELPQSLQAKLLRVLETRRFRRVGSTRERDLRARIVSATNRDLRGRPSDPLRGDLYFRLAGYRLETSPLRDRPEDIEPLTHHFLAMFAGRHPGAVEGISRQALFTLRTHRWPGNVRELRAVLLGALATATGRIEVRHVARSLPAARRPTSVPPPPPAPPSGVQSRASRPGLRDVERELIEEVYKECDGNVSRAAERLKIPRTTLRDRLKRYGIR